MINKLVTIIRDWLDERYQIVAFYKTAKQNLTKPVPKHVNWLFTLGTVALFLFMTQFVSGLLLMIYYKPDARSAYDSVKFIMEEVRFGWFIRQIHAWGANLMVLLVYLHMIKVFFYGSYKKPREVTWLVGFLLLNVVLGFAFTGYLLPWDQLSYWATTVGTESVRAVPFIGGFLLHLLRGGEMVGEKTLTRFFTIHVLVLPWVFMGLVSLHLFLIRYKSIAPLDSVAVDEIPLAELKKSGGEPFFPHHTLREVIVFLLVFALIINLALYSPFLLHPRADPFFTPEGIKPEWYFFPIYQGLKYFPEMVGIVGAGVVGLVLFLLPFIDRSPERHPARRPLATRLAIGFLLVAGILSILAFLAETDRTFWGTTYHFDSKGIPRRVGTSESGSIP